MEETARKVRMKDIMPSRRHRIAWTGIVLGEVLQSSFKAMATGQSQNPTYEKAGRYALEHADPRTIGAFDVIGRLRIRADAYSQRGEQ